MRATGEAGLAAAGVRRGDPGSRRWRGELLQAALTGLVLGVLLTLVLPTFADTDIFGHLRFGGDMLAGARADRPDPYSYLTAGHRWINHEWLSEVALAAIFQAGGSGGLVLVKGAIVLLLMLGFGRHALRSLTPLRALAFAVPPLVALSIRWIPVRPHLFSHLLFLLVIWALARAERGQLRASWLVPPALALWANLHGAFVLGLGLVWVWAAVHLVQARGRAHRHLAVAAAASLAVLATPYGPELLLFLLRTATGPRPDIGEWSPLTLTGTFGPWYALTLAFMVWGLTRSRLPRPPALTALLVTCALMPLLAMRHMEFFALACLLLLPSHVGDAWARWRPSPATRLRLLPTALIAGLVLALLVSDLPGRPIRCVYIGAPGTYPARATARLEASGVSANAATKFEWGEYLIFRLDGRLRVSDDGRRETVYGDADRAQQLAFSSGQDDWSAVLRRGADLALVRTGSPPANLLGLDPAWERVHRDATAELFARRASGLAARIRAIPEPQLPSDGSGRCIDQERATPVAPAAGSGRT